MALALAFVLLGSEALAADKPHIVYILADDLGYGDVHCLNPERGKLPTPHLDRLARQGMIFSDCHAGSSVCTPTRYGILTGRYAWRTRLQTGVLDGFPTPLIAADRLTVPALLRRHGYHTACIGKWHLGFTLEGKAADVPVGARTPDGPLTRGFDYFHGFQHARSMQALFENDRVVDRVEPVDMLPLLTRRAAAYIAARAKSDQPFFLYLALNAPHTPLVPSREWQGKSGLGAYGDFVMATDWAVGEVLAALEKAGLTDTTLVIAASDNGCSPRADVEHLEKQGHFPSGPFRGYKSDIWEGGHRIPFLLRWPGQVKPGRRCDALVCLTDLLATLADLFDVHLPAQTGEDSFSFLPELRGIGHSSRAYVVHHSIHGKFAIRQGNWKLALCPGSGGWSEPSDVEAARLGRPDVQLFDLSKDIGEQVNLHDQHPQTCTRLRALLEKCLHNGRSSPGTPRKNDASVDPWKPQRSRSPRRD